MIQLNFNKKIEEIHNLIQHYMMFWLDVDGKAFYISISKKKARKTYINKQLRQERMIRPSSTFIQYL
jgi:hypothetical protein